MPVTLSDIANEVGVSQQLVSKVLNGGRSRGSNAGVATRQRILETAARLGYRPNAAARAMRQNVTGHVGVLVRNAASRRFIHPLAFETILGINEGLEEDGLLLSIIRIDDLAHERWDETRVFRERWLDGLIVIDGLARPIEDRLEHVFDHVVWCDSNVWKPRLCIQRDEHGAGGTTVRRLHELGFRSIRWLTARLGADPVTHYSHLDRFSGALTEAQRLNMSIERIEVDNEAEPTPWLTTKLFDPEVALVPSTVNYARQLNQAATGLGLCPGYDFALACPDSAHELVRFWPGLSRVMYDRFGAGYRAGRMLVNAIARNDAPESERLDARWLPGSTAWGPRTFPRPTR